MLQTLADQSISHTVAQEEGQRPASRGSQVVAHPPKAGSAPADRDGVGDNGRMTTSSTPAPRAALQTQTVTGAPADGEQAETSAAPLAVGAQQRDIAEVAAVEVITTVAVHLMSAAAVKCGLSDSPTAAEDTDLDEARKLIIALAGLVTAGAPEIGTQHARSLRDGLRSLQLAFREASPYPDAPGSGPGEDLTGPVR